MMEKNYLRIGLQHIKELERSFYWFLYEKHIDWAIILGSFFVVVPYIGSNIWYFRGIKSVVFGLITLFSILYILSWKELIEYYKIKEGAIEKMMKLIDWDKVKAIRIEERKTLRQAIINWFELMFKYSAHLKNGGAKEDFEKHHNQEMKELQNILNKDSGLTISVIGSALLGMMALVHIRGIPKVEMTNYRRIKLIIFFDIVFFIFYNLEISFVP